MFLIVEYLIAVIAIAFICSMAEAAILSVPYLRVKIMVQQKRRGAKDLLYIKDHIALSVACLVIINNSVNIIGSMFIGQQVSQQYGDHWLGWASGIVTFLIIVIGEVIPKAIGERFKSPVSLMVAKIVRILTDLLKPLVMSSTFVLKFLSADSKTSRVTEEEVKMMIQIAHESGTLEKDEAELCDRVFRLNDIRTSNIMKPLREAYMLEAHKTLGEIKDKIISSPYNRIVVYDHNPNRVVGIVQHRILLREMAKDNHQSTIGQWMLKPIFVSHMMKLDALMEKFQTFHQHLFIVNDNMGRHIGLVTMEDVLEELFGEIYDEKDMRFKHLAKAQEKPEPDKGGV